MSASVLLGEWLGKIRLGDGTTPKLDADGFAHIAIPDAFTLSVAVNDERRTVGLFASLLPAAEMDAATLKYVLTLNLALAVVGGAALAVGEGGDVVYLRTAPIDALNADTFQTLLGESMSQAEGARNAILARASGAAPAPAVAEPASPSDSASSWLRI